ncbi:ABC transporter ATP-binding protein [Streptomyces sp. B6B3]|uniref:ABC transporter ATP-binding protein n=1 Tax=Streptomyces sp. B6B3 TaxID=3153570 RepID=UPI00325F01DF
MQQRDRLLWQVARSTGGWTSLFLGAALLDAAASLALPMALAAAIDAALGGDSTGPALVWLVTLLAVSTLAQVAAELVEATTAARATARLRHRALGHLFALDLGGQRRFAEGDLLNRLLQGTAETAKVGPSLAGAAVALLTSVAGIVALLLIDPVAGAVFLLGAPVVWRLARGFLGSSTELTERYQAAYSALAARFVDAMSGVRTLRASGTVGRETRRVLVPLRELRRHGEALWNAQRDVGWRLALLVAVLQVSVLATAGHGVIAGRVSPGELIALNTYLGYAFGVFRQVGTLAHLGRARGSAAGISEVLHTPAPAGGDGTGVGPPLPAGRGAVSLRGVRVTEGDRALLDGVDLDIPAGATVAVVGGSGGGKSTLAAVVGGLWRPDAGAVTIDGMPLWQADQRSVRDAVAHAFERPVLLGETVADAVAYGDRPVPPDALRGALRDSRAESFVERLPLGPATPVAGLRLSGGELQRLGLARALCRDARILVLDDTTSSLDTVTEREVSLAMDRAARHRTRLVVTHRAATVRRADLVVWVEDNGIRAMGSHEALAADPDYRGLFQQAPGDAGEDAPLLGETRTAEPRTATPEPRTVEQT